MGLLRINNTPREERSGLIGPDRPVIKPPGGVIKSIRPTVSRENAGRRLSSSWRELRRGRLEALIDFYIPFRLFRVEITDTGRRAEQWLALDGAVGELDLYSFDSSIAEGDLVSLTTDRVAEVRIDVQKAARSVEERVRRAAYLKGFFKVSDLRIYPAFVTLLHVPYWIGLYRKESRATIDVIDGVRNCFEGAKVREIVTDWFSSQD